LAPASDIAKAAEMLNTAKRPMIILGGGALAAGAAALQIAEAISAPVLTTVAGKGAIPAGHPLCWGYCLLSPDVQKLLLQSDCVLAVGTELSETDFWNTEVRLDGNLIRIDIDPSSLARPHAAKLPILGDAQQALVALAALAKPRKAIETAKPTNPESNEFQMMLSKILTTIRDSLPEETVIASDMTQIAYAANVVFPVMKPRTWLHPVGFGTLGFALPAAIGAKLGVGAKPVVALVGDYGLQYTLNELGTAVELELPLPILLWNNNALGQIQCCHTAQSGLRGTGTRLWCRSGTTRKFESAASCDCSGAESQRPHHNRNDSGHGAWLIAQLFLTSTACCWS
jgi:5-guanidino-2-oxopentanoate decarboxylase